MSEYRLVLRDPCLFCSERTLIDRAQNRGFPAEIEKIVLKCSQSRTAAQRFINNYTFLPFSTAVHWNSDYFRCLFGHIFQKSKSIAISLLLYHCTRWLHLPLGYMAPINCFFIFPFITGVERLFQALISIANYF